MNHRGAVSYNRPHHADHHREDHAGSYCVTAGWLNGLVERWPAVYGIEGNPIPESYLRQLVVPFRR